MSTYKTEIPVDSSASEQKESLFMHLRTEICASGVLQLLVGAGSDSSYIWTTDGWVDECSVRPLVHIDRSALGSKINLRIFCKFNQRFFNWTRCWEARQRAWILLALQSVLRQLLAIHHEMPC